MALVITIIHIIVSLLLITLVMLQTEGSGLGGTLFGGGDVFHSKRGIERSLFILTIVIAVIFSLTSIGNVVFS